jgi:metallophosphoesterase superfamily enzyme
MSKEIRPRLKGKIKKAYKNLTKDENRVLVIGDLHEPFCLDGYLEFCLDTYRKYNCNKVVLIGDVIDNHYPSFHETDADGFGGGEELERAIAKIQKWYKIFHKADVLLGNHDVMAMRKAQTSNVPKKWIKSLQEVLEVPGWNFVEEIEIDDVFYCHGIGSKAHIRAVKNMQSTVQGHHHTDAYVQWHVGKRDKIFGMQVGCGIDSRSYAMAYGKWFPKPAIGCGVVIGGHTAYNVLMDL